MASNRGSMVEKREQTGIAWHASDYFEYRIIAGPWLGCDARVVAQSTETPGTLDVEIRKGKAIRGPHRIPFDHLRFMGPKG